MAPGDRARLLLVLALSACGDGVRDGVAVTGCDPVAGEGCPVDQACRVLGDGRTQCFAAASAIAAERCTVESCPEGEACAIVEGVLACHALCRLDAPDAGCACAYRLAAGSPWGVCPRPCELGDDCGADATCAPTPALPHTICVATGPAEAHEPCERARCGHGLACLAREGEARCRRLCRPGDDTPCEVGTVCAGIVGGVEALGYCVAR